MAYVQTSPRASGNTDGTFASATTNGNAIIVCAWSWRTGLGAGSGAVSDNKGNTYTHLVSTNSADSNVAIWYCASIAGGSSHSIALIGDDSVVAFAMEWSGLTATPADKSNSGSSAGSSTAATGSTGTLSQADELVIAVASCSYNDGTDVVADPSGYTRIGQETDNLNFQAGNCAYKVVASTAAESASFALDASLNWSAVIGTFKLSGGGGSPTVKPLAALGVG